MELLLLVSFRTVCGDICLRRKPHLFLCCTVSHEFQYVIGVLHYITARLLAPVTIQLAQKCRQMDGFDETGVGLFLNLSCGHNNPFSKEEREKLRHIMDRSAKQRDEVV
jgi:hypothetical protein